MHRRSDLLQRVPPRAGPPVRARLGLRRDREMKVLDRFASQPDCNINKDVSGEAVLAVPLERGGPIRERASPLQGDCKVTVPVVPLDSACIRQPEQVASTFKLSWSFGYQAAVYGESDDALGRIAEGDSDPAAAAAAWGGRYVYNFVFVPVSWTDSLADSQPKTSGK